jgi:hypothetical protein
MAFQFQNLLSVYSEVPYFNAVLNISLSWCTSKNFYAVVKYFESVETLKTDGFILALNACLLYLVYRLLLLTFFS